MKRVLAILPLLVLSFSCDSGQKADLEPDQLLKLQFKTSSVKTSRCVALI